MIAYPKNERKVRCHKRLWKNRGCDALKTAMRMAAVAAECLLAQDDGLAGFLCLECALHGFRNPQKQ
jgi:hypothetical protein